MKTIRIKHLLVTSLTYLLLKAESHAHKVFKCTHIPKIKIQHSLSLFISMLVVLSIYSQSAMADVKSESSTHDANMAFEHCLLDNGKVSKKDGMTMCCIGVKCTKCKNGKCVPGGPSDWIVLKEKVDVNSATSGTMAPATSNTPKSTITGRSNKIAVPLEGATPLVAPLKKTNKASIVSASGRIVSSQTTSSSYQVVNRIVTPKPGHGIRRISDNKVSIVELDSGESSATVECSACSVDGSCAVSIKDGAASCARTCNNGCIIRIVNNVPTKLPKPAEAIKVPKPKSSTAERLRSGRLNPATSTDAGVKASATTVTKPTSKIPSGINQIPILSPK